MRSPVLRIPAALGSVAPALCLVVALLAAACSHSPAEAARFGSTPFEAPSPKAKPYRIKVVPGDTLYSLARTHGVELSALAKANGLSVPYSIRAGQSLEIPAPPVARVREGETLDQIARAYRVDREALAVLNDLEQDEHIYPGQRLSLPVHAASERLDGVRPAPRPTQSAAVQGPHPVAKPKQVAPKKPASMQVRTVSSSGMAPGTGGRALAWPVEGRVISTFGAKDGGLYNDGINIAVPKGTPVKAAEDGVVVYHGNELRAFGNLILLEHAGGVITAYAHNSRLKVRKGETVKRGQVIALAGQSGTVAESQLHFEVRTGTRPKDPLTFLAAKKILVSSR